MFVRGFLSSVVQNTEEVCLTVDLVPIFLTIRHYNTGEHNRKLHRYDHLKPDLSIQFTQC
jgi:hypothetical protein